MKKFTLIEIMGVLFIIIALVSIGVSAYGKVTQKTNATQIKAEIKMLQSAVQMYKSTYRIFPALSTDNPYLNKINNITIKGQEFIDPYGKAYSINTTTGNVSSDNLD
jgi:Tfp pilus assembly protein PilE